MCKEVKPAYGCTGPSSCCAYLVSRACPRHSISGKPGRTVDGTPAKVSFAGVIWESPVPRDSAEATFFNQAVSRIHNGKANGRETAKEDA